VYNLIVRRIQIHLDEYLDDAAEREAARRGTSKAALIRGSLAKELGSLRHEREDPWAAMTGWFEDGGMDDIDTFLYGDMRQEARPDRHEGAGPARAAGDRKR
jgi:Ribbon-helix-helix protein, copG family